MKNVFTFGCRLIVCIFLALVALPSLHAAKLKTENVFLVMSDGLRWQEIFRGADEKLISATAGGVRNTNALRAEFWRSSEEERRRALFPFLWTEVAQHGQIFGNTNKGSIARVTNGKKFSYPGYNETLSGIGDPRINSNDKNPNPNITVFEWLNQRPRFTKHVAVFGNWDVFPYIFNCERSQLPIWPAWDPKFSQNKIRVSPELDALVNDTTPIWSGATMDSLIFHGALGHVKQQKPKLTFIGFGETDEWAHERRYDVYLAAAHHVDRFVQQLWRTVQSSPHYRNKTTLIITCDHGRGSLESDWKDHGGWVPGAEYIWLAVIGPDTPALGERVNCGTVGQNQIAATIAALLGEDFRAASPKAGAPIADLLPATN